MNYSIHVLQKELDILNEIRFNQNYPEHERRLTERKKQLTEAISTLKLKDVYKPTN